MAVGECGLDYNRNISTPQAQRLAFEQQLSVAVETGKPLFLHCRDASTDFPMVNTIFRSQTRSFNLSDGSRQTTPLSLVPRSSPLCICRGMLGNWSADCQQRAAS